jgi:hypothetical protein
LRLDPRALRCPLRDAFSDHRLWAVTRDSISRNRGFEWSPRASFCPKSRIRAYFRRFLRRFLRKSCFIVKISPIVWTRGIRAGFLELSKENLSRNHLLTCSAAKTGQLWCLRLFTPMRKLLRKSRFIVKISPILWTRGIRAGFLELSKENMVRNHLLTCSAVQTEQLLRLHFFALLRETRLITLFWSTSLQALFRGLLIIENCQFFYTYWACVGECWIKFGLDFNYPSLRYGHFIRVYHYRSYSID